MATQPFLVAVNVLTAAMLIKQFPHFFIPCVFHSFFFFFLLFTGCIKCYLLIFRSTIFMRFDHKKNAETAFDLTAIVVHLSGSIKSYQILIHNATKHRYTRILLLLLFLTLSLSLSFSVSVVDIVHCPEARTKLSQFVYFFFA